MIGLISKIRSSVLWIDVLSAMEKHNYTLAIEKLRKAFQCLKREMPSPEVIPEYNIMCALLYFNLESHESSEKAAIIAMDQLSNKAQVHYNDHNENSRKYLHLYTTIILNSLPHCEGDTDGAIEKFDQIDLSKVESRLKSLFPIKINK